MDVYSIEWLDFYGGVVGMFERMRYHFLTKNMYGSYLEVGVQARMGVGTGIFISFLNNIWWELGDFIIDI